MMPIFEATLEAANRMLPGIEVDSLRHALFAVVDGQNEHDAEALLTVFASDPDGCEKEIITAALQGALRGVRIGSQSRST
jgi:hypothetical protein